MSNPPLKLVVLVSGNGSNLQALIDAIENRTLNAVIVRVISNRKTAYALERAEKHHVLTETRLLKPYLSTDGGREQYDVDLSNTIHALEPDLIVLAGWMHILSESFLSAVGCDVINLHPALPGAFAGINAVERAFEAYQRGEILYSGCMIHHVIPEVDAGSVVVQETVAILPDDSLETFAARMHDAEHRIIVKAVQFIEREQRPSSSKGVSLRNVQPSVID